MTDCTLPHVSVEYAQDTETQAARELLHKALVKLDSIEGLTLLLKDALFPPAPVKKRKKRRRKR